MFILVPTVLIVIACIGIAVIVSRKLPYLKKLTPESHEFGPSIFHDFFPEMFQAFSRIHFEEYYASTLRELEKLLRRIRLLFSRIDSASSALISELRTINVKQQVTQEANEAPVLPPTSPTDPHVEIRSKKSEMSPSELKAKEQQLIIDIAQHPKDAKLYGALGEVYVQLQNFEDAKDAFEAAIELDKTNETLKHRLSFTQRRLHENKLGF